MIHEMDYYRLIGTPLVSIQDHIEWNTAWTKQCRELAQNSCLLMRFSQMTLLIEVHLWNAFLCTDQINPSHTLEKEKYFTKQGLFPCSLTWKMITLSDKVQKLYSSNQVVVEDHNVENSRWIKLTSKYTLNVIFKMNRPFQICTTRSCEHHVNCFTNWRLQWSYSQHYDTYYRLARHQITAYQKPKFHYNATRITWEGMAKKRCGCYRFELLTVILCLIGWRGGRVG